MNNELRIRRNILGFIWVFLLSVIFSPLFNVQGALAAQFSFNAPDKVGLGKNFQVDFVLDTEVKDINAIAGKITFDQTKLILQQVKSSDSIITLWVKDPAQVAGGAEVEFTGITPGGYNSRGQQGNVFSLIFKAIAEGETSISVDSGATTALLSDGQGTKAPVKIKNIQLTVDKDFVGPEIKSIEDKESPEPLFAQIIQDKSIADNKWVVVFYTHDKNSGISHYEVAEQKDNQTAEYNRLSWQRAESPYVLADQKRESFVYIKAVDKAKNETVLVLPPQTAVPAYATIWFWCIIAILLFLLGGYLWRRQKKIIK